MNGTLPGVFDAGDHLDRTAPSLSYNESGKGRHYELGRIRRMSRQAKLYAAIRNNPRAVRFDDACKAARHLGFAYEGGSGSHRVFKRKGEPVQLNFQNRGGSIPPYQGRQLIAMIDKYEQTP